LKNLNSQEESGFHQDQYSTSKDFIPKVVSQRLWPITKFSDLFMFITGFWYWVLI